MKQSLSAALKDPHRRHMRLFYIFARKVNTFKSRKQILLVKKIELRN